MRILFLTAGLGSGGAELTLIRLREQLEAAGYTCVVAVPEDGIERGYGDYLGTLVKTPNYRRQPLAYLRSINRAVAELDIDVIHAFAPTAGALGGLGNSIRRRCRRTPLIIRLPAEFHALKPTARLFLRLSAPFVDCIVAVSAAARDSLPSRLRKKASVLVHGVDVERIRGQSLARVDARQRLMVGDSEFCIGVIGSLKWEKDHMTLLQAIAQSLEANPEWRLHLLGAGPLKADIEAQAGRHHIATQVVLHGDVPHAWKLLPGMDCVLSASTSEGMPVALMEAVAAGVPIICSEIPTHRELVDLVGGGQCLDFRSAEAPKLLCNALETLQRSSRPVVYANVDSVDLKNACQEIIATYEKLMLTR